MPLRALLPIALLVAVAALGCRQGMGSPEEEARRQAGQAGSVEEVLSRHNGELLEIPGVVGTGVGEVGGRPAIVVFVQVDRDTSVSLPDSLEGHPVIVQATGRPSGR